MLAVDINIVLVFFVYGLAFFSMGLVMLMEAGRSPLIAETKALYLLSVFGFIHGIHEWLEVAINQSEWLQVHFSAQIGLLRIGLLAVSFLPLLLFGLHVLRPEHRFTRREISVGLGILSIYLIWVASVTLFTRSVHADWLQHSDALIRYTLAVPGAFVTGLALNQQGQIASQAGHQRLCRYLQWAGLGFMLYGLTQVFVPPADYFPATLVNSAAFNRIIGLPIQVFRAAFAAFITVSLLRASQEAEIERRRQYEAIRQSRLEAVEQIKSDVLEREALRRELLRHIVVAQEDERARIARELHDETAQVLTAFSLNLAALRDNLPDEEYYRTMLARLQTLSRQMSQGIYNLVHDLRPAQLDDLGLVAALSYLADQEQKRTGVKVEFSIIGVRQRLEPLVETVLFRVAQEALANVARHAQVSQAAMTLGFSSEDVTLIIADQGIGFDTRVDLIPPRGWGLAGMRERAESLDGKLSIASSPGDGTIVKVVMPIQAARIMDDEAVVMGDR